MEESKSEAQHNETPIPVNMIHDTPETKGAVTDNDTEHNLTLLQLWKESPGVICWSFYWAMCAIGWYV